MVLDGPSAEEAESGSIHGADAFNIRVLARLSSSPPRERRACLYLMSLCSPLPRPPVSPCVSPSSPGVRSKRCST